MDSLVIRETDVGGTLLCSQMLVPLVWKQMSECTGCKNRHRPQGTVCEAMRAARKGAKRNRANSRSIPFRSIRTSIRNSLDRQTIYP